jgi:cytidine deaminase
MGRESAVTADRESLARLAELRDAAQVAFARAYAPYSSFRVGAALLGTDGTIVSGCNVENASYPATICAERSAVGMLIARGIRHFSLLVLVTDADDPAPPCGICRQVLAEFEPTLVIISYGRGGTHRRWTLAELLPVPFDPHFLHHS